MVQFPITEKIWGRETLLCNTDLYCAKYLDITPGGVSSLHKHVVKDETFVILSGKCWFRFGGEVFQILNPGDQVRISPGKPHRFMVPLGGEPCRILEVSTHHEDSDSYRLQPSARIK